MPKKKKTKSIDQIIGATGENVRTQAANYTERTRALWVPPAEEDE